jgi:hypothetical protein
LGRTEQGQPKVVQYISFFLKKCFIMLFIKLSSVIKKYAHIINEIKTFFIY